jgi:GT2 family glycosyltransferase
MTAGGDATVVVVTWNGAHLLPSCLDALLAERPARLLVVDNASTDGSASMLRERYPAVDVLAAPRNLGFAGGVDLALREVTTPYAVLVNNDAVVRPGFLAMLLGALAAPKVGAAQAKLLLPDGRINSAGGELLPDGYARDRGAGEIDDDQYDEPAELAFGCGAALALRIDAVRAVGGIDPSYFLYYEDVDLCWRLRAAGYVVRYEPRAVAVHDAGATTGHASARHIFYSERNRLLTLMKNAPRRSAWLAVLRFPLSTLSIAVHESRAVAWTRTRAYFSFLARLPRTRRAAGRG